MTLAASLHAAGDAAAALEARVAALEAVGGGGGVGPLPLTPGPAARQLTATWDGPATAIGRGGLPPWGARDPVSPFTFWDLDPEFTYPVVVVLASGRKLVGQSKPLGGVPVPGDGPPAWLYPGSSSSPWKRAVGSGADYSGDQAWWSGATVNDGNGYSHPIRRASSTDPWITMQNGGSYHVPADAHPASGSDHHFHIVDPTGRWVDEHWDVYENPWRCGYWVHTDLLSDLLGGGTRACGMSAIAGELRDVETAAGVIRHPIAIALPGSDLKMGPVWPASSEDGHAASVYHGDKPMGSLWAIPPGVTVDESDPCAVAARDYGCYVTDLSGGFSLYAEPGTPADRVARMQAGTSSWVPLLRRVLNNGPDSVGGGGTPRQPDQPDPVAV